MPLTETLMDNPRSQRIRRLAELKERRARQRHERFLIEGPQSVREAVDCRSDLVTDLYVQTGDAPGQEGIGFLNPVVAAIAENALQHDNIYVHPVTERVMKAISTDAQGIVAQGDTRGMAVDPADLMVPGDDGERYGQGGPDLIAAFWQVRDPGNAGTVIRTADAAGCRALVLVDDCVDPLNPKVLRSTAGSAFHIPILTMGTDDFLDWVHGRGDGITAADVYGTPDRKPTELPDLLAREGAQSGSGSTTGGPARGRVVLFGNEARGLPPELLQRMDSIVSIPIYGRAESLNLATSAAVLLYGLAMSSRIERM